MQTTAPGVETIVDAPPLLPPTSGLLQVASVIEHFAGDFDYTIGDPDGDDRDHWMAGIRWTVPNNQGADLVDACNPFQALSVVRSGSTPGQYYPFGVVEEDTCYNAGLGDQWFRDRAAMALRAREPGRVEAQFERGVLGPTLNPHLADSTDTGIVYLASTANSQATQLAVSPKDALAVLDEAIAYSNIGLGMIHAPWYVVAQWIASRAVIHAEAAKPPTYTIRASGNGWTATPDDPDEAAMLRSVPQDRSRVLFSPNGNPIVAGSGYRGVSPDGSVVPDQTVAGHSAMWCYATDLVVVHRDDRISYLPDNMAQALDRQTNTVTWRAWRAYAFAWNRLLHAAVKVNTVLSAAP